METRAADAVDELLQTYSATGGINYLDAAATLPSRQVIEGVCAELMSLMFPGFRGEALVDSADLPAITRSRIRSLRIRLKPEICKSFGDYPGNAETQSKAEEILNFFVSQLPEVRGQIRHHLLLEILQMLLGSHRRRNLSELIMQGRQATTQV